MTPPRFALSAPARPRAPQSAKLARRAPLVGLLLALLTTSAAAAGADAPAAAAGTPAVAGSALPDAEFFEQNAHQPGVIVLPGGDQARLLSAGEGASAEGANVVVVNLSRRALRDAANVADAQAARRGQRYQTQSLPRPLFEALQRMHVGDRWEVYARAHVGKSRRLAGHKPDPSLPATIFTVELIAAN